MKLVTSSLALAALALAACNSGNASVGARFSGPTAIAPFAGNLHKAGGKLRDYLAVASSRADEVVVVDPSDEQPVLGPGAVFPLSIPTDPRPVRIAAATLGDRGDVAGADLLVVVSSGSLVLQLVNTWNPDAARVEPQLQPDGTGGSVDLGAVAQIGTDAEILSVVAFPLPQRDATGAVTAPRARLVAGLTGGRLAVVDFVRGAARQGEDPASPPVVPVAAGGAPTVNVKAIGVDPLDLAVDPDGARLFAATRDAVGADAGGAPLFGVMQVQALEDAAATWPTTGLGANAATLAVASARVRERNVFAFTDPDAADKFDQSAGVVRVYAALDQDGPNGCGPQRLIACGVATLQPTDAPAAAAVALAPDFASLGVAPPTGGVTPPVPAMDFRAPMQVPGTPVSIAIGLPVLSGTERVLDALNGTAPLITVEHAYGPRNTPAVAAVTSTTGNVYLLDLGRGAPVNDISFALSAVPSVTVAATAAPGAAPFTAQLGLAADFPVAPSARQTTDPASTATGISAVPTVLPRLVQVTPGFTGNHDYALTWQGALPGLDTRRGTLVVSAGTAFAAYQLPKDSSTPADPASWVVAAQVAAPELGARVGDLLDVTCPDATPGRTTIAEVLQPGAVGAGASAVATPAGALRLDAVPCLVAGGGALPDGVYGVTLTVRAAQLVLTRGPTGQGAHVEYVGRPPPFDPANITSGVVYALEWQRETSALSPEQLALARLARRVFYPQDNPCSSTPAGCASEPWFVDPLTPGPVVAFKVALIDTVTPPSTDHLAPGAALTFTTVSGYSPAFRRPVTAGVLPRAITAFDRTKFAGHLNDPLRFYATYLDDEVLSFSPRDASGVVRSIR